MRPEDALRMAKDRDLDLVEIVAQANPPVCRIMNYGKYLYQKNKRAHEAKKHQKQIQVKEIKFRVKIDEHDYAFKKNHVERFLMEGNKVKTTIMFRGRERSHGELGVKILDRLISELQEIATIEHLAVQAAKFATPEFDFLYDTSRRLLAIGYNVTERRRDTSFYDLLASEARLASFLGVALLAQRGRAVRRSEC